MKISDLLAKLAGKDPEEDITEDVFKEEEKSEPEQVEEKPEEQPEEEVSAEEEKPVEEPVKEEAEQPVEQPVEEKVEEVKEIVEEKSPVDILLQKQQELESKIAELESKNNELSEQKKALDAQQRIEEAKAAGWLLPSMLQENDEGKPSVFVDLAREQPEMFDRLKLVMAPKSIPKPLLTEAPVEGINTVLMSDDELYNRISALAKEKGISYAEAAKLLR